MSGPLEPCDREAPGLSTTAYMLLAPLDRLGVPLGMGCVGHVNLTRLAQPLDRIGLDAVEQPVAHGTAFSALDGDQGSVDQAADRVQDRSARYAQCSEDVLGRVQGGVPREARESPQAALVVGEQ